VNLFAKDCTRVCRRIGAATAALVLVGGVLLIAQGCSTCLESQKPGKCPEQIVYARSTDDIINAGVIFTPPTNVSKPIAIIWVHGWGVNFYQPTYVGIGRALAERGYTCINVNTRMHDLGNVAAWRGGKRIRGGGYWGVASEEVRDLAGWVDFAERLGFKKVALVGHSAGWAAVRNYVAEKQDRRVVGVVVASGTVRSPNVPPDPDQLAEATRLMEKGEGDALVRDPKRSFPSYISAATFLDIAKGHEAKTPNRWMKEIRCPVLAFYGTRGDVGNEGDLDFLKSSLARESRGTIRVDTLTIKRGDHMYAGEEVQVAEGITKWADALSQEVQSESK
jgi:pimeloyl-ACP methyl ester carboxylesterase